MALFNAAPPLEEVERALATIGAAERVSPTAGWLGGFPGLVLHSNRTNEGRIVVDVVDRPWPDTMGHPQADPDLFSCWCLGGFGSHVYPGSLERAAQHAYAAPGVQALVSRHRAFVRVRKTAPPSAEPLTDLAQLVAVARALLELPDALAYFQPNGEVVLDRAALAASIEHAERTGVPALELHVNVRLWRVEDASGWILMDTVGLEQVLVPDLEALCDPSRHDENTVARFLRNVSLYQLRHGDVLAGGDTLDGPGGKWRVERVDESRVAPPRPVVRLTPAEHRHPDGARLGGGAHLR